MNKQHYQVFYCRDDTTCLEYMPFKWVVANDAKEACMQVWRVFATLTQPDGTSQLEHLKYDMARVIRHIEKEDGVFMPELEFDVELHIDFDGTPHILSISKIPSQQRHYNPTKTYGDEQADYDLTYKEGE